MIKMTPRIPDPAEIEEVDGFGQDLETLQHDSMQRWYRLNSCTVLLEATCERIEREVEGRRTREG
jgi:hypothetical protein